MGKEGDNVNTLAQGVSIAAKLIYMAIHIMLPSCKQVVQTQDLSAGGPPNQHQTILRPPFTFVQHLSEGIRKGDPNIIMCLLAFQPCLTLANNVAPVCHADDSRGRRMVDAVFRRPAAARISCVWLCALTNKGCIFDLIIAVDVTVKRAHSNIVELLWKTGQPTGSCLAVRSAGFDGGLCGVRGCLVTALCLDLVMCCECVSMHDLCSL